MKHIYLSIVSKNTGLFFAVFGLVIIMLLQVATNQSIHIVLAQIAVLTVSILFLYRLDFGILAFLLLRPSIDRQADYVSFGLTNNLSLNIAAIFGVLVIIFFLVYCVKYAKLLQKLPMKFSWLLVLGVLFFGIFYSIEPRVGVYEFIRITSIFAIFVLVLLAIQNKLPIKHVLYTILFSAVIPFLVAIYQIVSETGLSTTFGVSSRVYGTFSHPSPFAFYALTIIAVSLYLIILEKKKITWLYLFFGPAVIILLFTFTRGAWLALVTFLAIIASMKAPRVLIGIVIFSLVIFFSSITVHDRVEDIYNPPADSSIRWRFKQWENMFELALDKPVLGYGTGTEAIVHYYSFGSDAGNPYTHNDFLKIALENGIVGFIAFAMLIINCWILLFSKFYKAHSQNQKDLYLVVLVLFSVFILVSFGDNVLRSTATQWVLWSLIAVSLASGAVKSKKIE